MPPVPKIIERINEVVLTDTNLQGSYRRLNNVLSSIPQVSAGKINYLVSGTWAIEFLGGKKLDLHKDIDIISVSEPPFYFDDSIEVGEHCCEVIPLPEGYFDRKKSIVACKDIRGDGIVYTPNLNLQLCLKLLGTLEKKLSDIKILQLENLIQSYKIIEKEDEEEIYELFFSCIPETVDSREMAKKTVQAIFLYGQGRTEESIILLREIHKIINSALQEEFKKMDWESYSKNNQGTRGNSFHS